VAGPVGARRKARECALQVLYALDVTGALAATAAREAEVERALASYWRGFEEERDAAIVGFCETIVRGVGAHLDGLDQVIQEASRNWRLDRMARVDRNILRLATWELRHAPETPAKVVINEAIEVAKRFGSAESPAFVNGILDRISQELARR
jgi:transcription antitermination protein NusB